MTDSNLEKNLHQQLLKSAPQELLNLCYGYDEASEEKVRRYFAASSQDASPAGRFAAGIFCFDLAERGIESCQNQFGRFGTALDNPELQSWFLVQVGEKTPLALSVWERCQSFLRSVDARFSHLGADVLDSEPVDLDQLDIVEADELFEPELEATVELSAKERETLHRFHENFSFFCGDDRDYPRPMPYGGFRLNAKEDVDRVERFLNETQEAAQILPEARAHRAWVLLFYGTHMRSKRLFGLINRRKQSILREGLREFHAMGPQMWQYADLFQTSYADASVWQKISELLMDFTNWLNENPAHAGDPIQNYDPVDRLNRLYSRRGRNDKRTGPR